MNVVIRSMAAGLVVGLVACAHVEAPPGGPEDREPPGLLTTRPDFEAVVSRYDGPVVFVFDERISERDIQEESVIVSPRTSPVEIRHGRDEIRVSLRRGWEAGVIYQVTVRPVVQDLFGNRIAEPIRLVFSTGPEIPETLASGRVVDRISGEPELDLRVEAIRSADSLVYAVPTDSAGRFTLDRIPEGDYQLRAFRDMNRNRSLEMFEPRDSTFVEIRAGQPVTASLAILAPDSTPPIARGALFREGLLVVEFDDHLDPAQTVDPGQVTVTDAAGALLTVARAAVGTLPEEVPTPVSPVDTAGPADPAPLPTGVPDPSGPPATLPSQELVIALAEGAEPAPGSTVTIVVTGVLNVNGLAGGGEAETEIPEPPAEPPEP